MVACLLGTIAATATVAVWMLAAGPRGVFLPGETTAGHHQIELACESCHRAPPFAGSVDAAAALNDACLDCHADELRDAKDSHAAKLFRGPRMARYRRALDARHCTACHVEHHPEITWPGAVTVATDFCVACHSEGEQDVRASRPSHAGAAFENCASAGCHNYHDNRALYEDFLLAHADEPWLLVTPERMTALASDSEPRADDVGAESGPAKSPNAPAAALAGPEADDWARSAHAAAQVRCAACHAPTVPEDATAAAVDGNWIAVPDTAPCVACHVPQATTFAQGRHGMRAHPLAAPARNVPMWLANAGFGVAHLAEWLADAPPPTAMTVAEARPPMRPDAADRTVNCVSCHGPHAVDVRRAAAQACASCHDDAHSRAYFSSPHHDLWQRELAGGPAGTGVSCATCHMEQRKRRGKVETSHDQNALLRPNEKMIRPVCMHCHGLGFAIDALADEALVAANFRGQPSAHVPSIDWALRRAATESETVDSIPDGL